MRQRIVAFRTNSSASAGMGHLRRSMTLAQQLQKHGARILFAVSQDPNTQRVLDRHGFQAVSVSADDDQNLKQTLEHAQRVGAHVLVIDSYTVDVEHLAGRRAPVVVVIDDLADRFLPVDLVVNGGATAGALAYKTSPHTKLLLGPEYLLLREEFAAEPDRVIREQVRRVLITVGGMDPENLTPRLIAWTRWALGEVGLDIVIGPFFDSKTVEDIERLAREAPAQITIHKDPPQIRELMLRCDLAIAGGGQTTYELAATGTPAVAIRLTDNQTGNVRSLSEHGALVWIGDAGDHDLESKVVGAVRDLANGRRKREDMSRAGRALVDGNGAKRVAQAVLEACPG